MFVTLDVVFHEDSIYFSRSDLPGEYQDELQTLYYEVHMPTDVLPNNQNESSIVDTSMNVDLYIYIYIYIYANDDNDSQSGNQDMGIVMTSSDDS
jgi:hypothetical protein